MILKEYASLVWARGGRGIKNWLLSVTHTNSNPSTESKPGLSNSEHYGLIPKQLDGKLTPAKQTETGLPR